MLGKYIYSRIVAAVSKTGKNNPGKEKQEARPARQKTGREIFGDDGNNSGFALGLGRDPGSGRGAGSGAGFGSDFTLDGESLIKKSFAAIPTSSKMFSESEDLVIRELRPPDINSPLSALKI